MEQHLMQLLIVMHHKDLCQTKCLVGLQIAANIALVKNWTIHGIFWGAHQVAQPRVFRRTLEESVQWLSEGKVRVPVSHK